MEAKDWADLAVVGLVVIALIVFIFGAAGLWDRANCVAATRAIGIPSRWGFFSGCLVEVEPDTWIPLGNYRWLDE